MITRRQWLQGVAAGSAVLALPPLARGTNFTLPPAITPAERLRRLAKAQTAMREAGLRAVFVEAGSSLVYYTGIEWWRSERLTALVIPAEGEPLVVTPAFEEPSIREMLVVPAEVRVWNEHESPYAPIHDWLTARKLAPGPVGIEETVRFFAVEGLRKAGLSTRDDAGVVRMGRMVKSPAEIALMQAANDITLAAYRDIAPKIGAGMESADIGKLMAAATSARGGRSEFTLILIGEASAYPHGSRHSHQVREGEIVLMDCGCSVEGYQSDISRTMVYGKPTKRQREVWALMRRGQQIAFEAAKIGTPAGVVDDAVRAVYEKVGFGPGYQLPGTSHRTGHGIGLDGHEPVNFVHGEKTRLAPGMCFSNEPGLYIPGEFGVRLEDCLHMTPEGPRWFTTPPDTIDAPFG